MEVSHFTVQRLLCMLVTVSKVGVAVWGHSQHETVRYGISIGVVVNNFCSKERGKQPSPMTDKKTTA